MSPPQRWNILRMPSLTVKVLETLQAQDPDYQMELVGGEIL